MKKFVISDLRIVFGQPDFGLALVGNDGSKENREVAKRGGRSEERRRRLGGKGKGEEREGEEVREEKNY